MSESTSTPATVAVAAPLLPVGLRARLDGYVARRVPPGASHDVEVRARLAFVFAHVFSVLATAYSGFCAGVGRGLVAVLAGMTACLMVVAVLLMRRRFAVGAPVHLVIFAGWLAIVAVAQVTGGLAAPSIGWLALVPIGAMFLAGRRAGKAWFFVSIVSAGGFLALDLAGHLVQHEADTTTLLIRRLVALVVLIGLTLMMMQLYESAKTRMHAALAAANEELARSRDAAHAVAAELEVAQARLIEESRQQRQLELELRQAQKLEAVGRLAAGVAHELNTPLQFVADSVGFVEDSTRELTKLLKQYRALVSETTKNQSAAGAMLAATTKLLELEDAIDLSYLLENTPTALSRSVDGLQRMASIVKAMKEFAHADQVERVPLDINQAIATTLVIARAEYREHASIETQFGDVPHVMCRGGEINQVFLNLVVNAAHAIADVVGDTGERGRITIRTKQVDQTVVVSISDTGTGISEAVGRRIFEPFFTTKGVGRGTGQGLAIARNIIVDKHAGQIAFDSQPGRGTTFRIVLPIESATRVGALQAA